MKVHVKRAYDGLNANGYGFLLFKDDITSDLPEGIKKSLQLAIDKGIYTLDSGKIRVFYDQDVPYIVVGLGNKTDDLDLDDIRLASDKLLRAADAEKVSKLAVKLQHSHIDRLYAYKAFAEMTAYAAYSFDTYLSKKKHFSIEEIILIDPASTEAHNDAVTEGVMLAEAVNVARLLVDEPSNKMYPETLANHVLGLGKKHSFEVDVYEEDQIKKLGMQAFMSVAKGSSQTPRFIVMRYKGHPTKDSVLGLVGKGLTYDAGGYSIKTATGMETMKTDMGGAGAVIGAMTAIATAKLPVNVTAVVAACENLISGHAYKPGDILTTMAGKTIYIGNTDAEGRLTLVDAIAYIVKHENVSQLVDMATLTGAALVALGTHAALTVSNDDNFYYAYEEASRLTGEKVWRMPAFKEFDELIKHHEADYTNMGGRPGSVTAALLLREFTEGKPWVHVDIAGVAHYTKPQGYYQKGASGYGVKTLYELAKHME